MKSFLKDKIGKIEEKHKKKKICLKNLDKSLKKGKIIGLISQKISQSDRLNCVYGFLKAFIYNSFRVRFQELYSRL